MTSIVLFALGIAFITAIPAYIAANVILQHGNVRR